MSDPIPEGYISLTEAWDAYLNAYPESTNPEVLVEPFANAELHAFVRFPHSDQNYRLTPASWREQFFSDHVFLQSTILPFNDDPWTKFSGRSPFVREADFSRWLEERRRIEQEELERQFDPFSEPWWTISMAAQWIANRTPEAVRSAWDAFRQKAGFDRRASVALMELDSGPIEVVQELLNKASASETRISARRIVDDEIVTIPAHEIPYLSLTFDGPPTFDARLEKREHESIVYRDVRVLSADLVRLWPRDSSSVNGHNTGPERSSHRELWRQAEEWFLQRIEAWRTGKGGRLTRSEVVSELNNLYQIPSTISREVWKMHKPSEWRSGPHKKGE